MNKFLRFPEIVTISNPRPFLPSSTTKPDATKEKLPDCGFKPECSPEMDVI